MVKNMDTISEQELSNFVSMVQQETFLFNMSIKDNIKIGNKDASDEQVIQVAKKAQIHDMITGLPKGYDTMVGESGAKLSGGEKTKTIHCTYDVEKILQSLFWMKQRLLLIHPMNASFRKPWII